MKHLALTVFLSSVLAASASMAQTPTAITGTVIGVTDGDTLTILDANKVRHIVRLAEIDAPEIGHGKPGQPFGHGAKQSLASICFGQPAQATVASTDRYGRLVARVNCNGRDANAEQVRAGMAWVYDKYAKDLSLRADQDKARAAKIGLWREASPVAPWDWRNRHHKPDAVALAY